MKIRTVVLSLAVLCSTRAQAVSAANQGHVTLVEATYIPNDVRLRLDQPFGSCAAGAYLYYQVQGNSEAQKIANAQGVLATLLTARAGQIAVAIGGDDNGCKVSYVVLL